MEEGRRGAVVVKPKSTVFVEACEKIKNTAKGKEAAIYGPMRDVFVDVLGYKRAYVDIDTSGEGGRPDLTVKAHAGVTDTGGTPLLINWIVVEVKAERGVFADTASREETFSKKSKYIGPNTAWFVMVDPTVIIARPVYSVTKTGPDIVFKLDGTETETEFKSSFARLHGEVSGVPDQLTAFRAGNLELIATEKLSPPKASDKAGEVRAALVRRNFFSALRFTTQLLQQACRQSLTNLRPELDAISTEVEKFGEAYGGYKFNSQPINIQGRPKGREQALAHDRDAAKLRKLLRRNPAISRLAIEGLRGFKDRTGADDKLLEELFAIETANLILARILLIRFLEDHEFFGKLKYVCNGGVESFQKMKEYFSLGYTRLLEEAYRTAGRLYASAFDETELDWVFGASDSHLSAAIEWSMFQLSRYDFQTVKGDVLTGIYDRFLDRDQRKRLGEFYTPPSVARFIVERTNVKSGTRVFDPSCGSGTFLIEAYRKAVGKDAERGAADYKDVLATLEHIAGNDINTFSAVLAQVQLLWQILPFRNEIAKSGFPDLRISEKANSLTVSSLDESGTRFSELDHNDYDVVVGNPPYVRAERSAQDLDSRTSEYFSSTRGGHSGISPKLNTYALFMYRALDSWCKPPDEKGENAGRLGFIVPVSFFDSNENSALRQLFAVGGRWTIREIVDLETIYNYVFDAWTYPAILIIEARPATSDDTVTIRLADRGCVVIDEDHTRPELNLAELAAETIPYDEIFTPDGRIMTRVTAARVKILKKLWKNLSFAEAAKPYWVRKSKSKIVAWQSTKPADAIRWEQREMIAGGIAFRREKPKTETGGLNVFKGENIIAGEIQGEPIESNIDVSGVNDPSIWSYLDILPERGFAIAQIAHCPNATPFNPHREAFLNTATVFFPRDELSKVPFDLILLSKIYQFFYSISARMGVIRAQGSHIYPTNLRLLPWNEALIGVSDEIEKMRGGIIKACRTALRTRETMFEDLAKLGVPSLKSALLADESLKIIWSSSFDVPDHTVEVSVGTLKSTTDGFQLALSGDLLDWVEVNNGSVGEALRMAMELRSGELLKKSDLLALSVPLGPKAKEWETIARKYHSGDHVREMDLILSQLDVIVGTALGLSSTDIGEVQADCRQDAFLRRIQPRYPGAETRKQGHLEGLDRADRYG